MSASLVASVLLLSLPNVRGAGLQVSEVMYFPPSTNRLEAWFEVHNASPNPFDLSGCRVTRGVTFTFPSKSVLAPDAYLVVAADFATFQRSHPDITNVVGGWEGVLSHDGDEIRVEDPNGNRVAAVAFAAEGDWAMRRLGDPDRLKRQGWEWFAEHRGLGKSLELVNPDMPVEAGQNWGSSRIEGGTPGRANSIRSSNAAPLLLDVTQVPAVPHPTDSVAVRARVLDERTSGVEVRLHWRIDGTASFQEAPMADDGAHGEGIAGDRLYGAWIPPQAQGRIVEFYLTAVDAEGQERRYPTAEASSTGRTANLVYQVDGTAYAGSQPLFRLIMTQAEFDYLSTQIWGGEPFSDAAVSGTWISLDGVLDGGSSTQVRYQCDFRNRGHGTRTAVPHNFHVGFPKDQPWKGRAGLNLNTHYTHSQQLGSALFRLAGIPMPESRPVQVRVNGSNLAKPGQEQFGSYAANEVMDGGLAARQFPLDPGGNLYRGIRDMIPGIDSVADLTWHGPAYESYTNAYAKENHTTQNDWSDLLHLIEVLNHTPEAEYVQAVTDLIDVDEWMKYFAMNTLLDNQENSLGIGEGDDFALYRGQRDSRFLVLPYDMDSVLGRGQRSTSYADGLWRMAKLPVIDRLVKRPEFAPLYYRHLLQLAGTTFSPAQMNPFLDQLLAGYVDATALANLKAFNSSHVAYVLSQIPRALEVTHGLPVVSGYPRTPSTTVTLGGHAPPAETQRVLVNGITATWVAWQGSWTNANVPLQPGVNRVLVQALGEADREIERTSIEIWMDDGSTQSVAGNLSGNVVWSAAAGPYALNSTVTVGAGATLTIGAGTSVYLGSGVNLIVANGGRLIAEGTATAPIRFLTAPGATTSWGGIVINGAVGSPESRMAYVEFVGNGTTCLEVSGGSLSLDHATFGTRTHPYVSLDGASFVISHCRFPPTSAAFEPMHGTGGVRSDGRGIVRDCYFGSSSGYNDIVDFTGGNRPGQPIVQFVNNVFEGSTDDILDLDGTDAWIEGNIFLRVHRNGAPDSSAAVSGGSSGGNTSELTVIGNLFFDCDNAVTIKQGNFCTLLHNTIVRVTNEGGVDFASGVINVRDTTPDVTTFGRGAYAEGNIVVDAAQLVRNYDPQQTTVTWVDNLVPVPWTGPGQGNRVTDPLLVHIPTVNETLFGDWAPAQILRTWLAPGPGSPARAAGAFGRDLGGVIPLGAAVSGEPSGVTRRNWAVLSVGPVRDGSGIPAAGFPNGSGFTQYRWQLDGGPWSAAVATSQPLALTNLVDGSHWVEVVGRNDAGLDQDDPAWGTNAVVTATAVWTVDSNWVEPPVGSTVRINEVLASNSQQLTTAGTTPDWIELYNFGSAPVDLSGMGLTDDVSKPYRYAFPAGTLIPAGGFLVLSSDPAGPTNGLGTGFDLNASGDALYLFDAAGRGGGLLDSIQFGVQIPDRSIGRWLGGGWGLCRPTFGGENEAERLGDPRSLRLNEWLTDTQFVATHDFVELYNRDSWPVALGGLFLSDAAGAPARHPIPALSFIAARGYARFVADGDPARGSDHLSFKLAPEVGGIWLFDADLGTIDVVSYASQRTDISEGRSPDGADTFATFLRPTPGSGNPGELPVDCTRVTNTVSLVSLSSSWRYEQAHNLDGTGWSEPAFDDAAWPSGPGLLGVENSTLPAPGLQTSLTLGRTTYYFRTHFVVATNLEDYALSLRTVVDDGALVYLNGIRVLTNGLSSGTPGYSTFASRNVDNASIESFALPASILVPGTNVLAVEVHQVNSTSSDIVWGLALDATRVSTNCTANGALPIVLNEVHAAKALATRGDAGLGFPDFVEIYNPSATPVDLTGASLSDDMGAPGKWVFPPGWTLPAGGYRALTCDGSLPASSTNTGFGLSATGGGVYLFAPAEHGAGLVDGLSYGLQAPGFSLGRFPAGVGAWRLGTPTPDAPNASVELGNASALRLNEWMADPDAGPDWFELYNPGDRPVALEGLALTDDLGRPDLSPLAPLSFIGVGTAGFVKFVADGQPGAGADHAAFSLKKSGEALGLYSAGGILIDGVVYGAQQTGVSEGRLPDGGAAFVSFPESASPGAANRQRPGGRDDDGDGMEDGWELRYFGDLSRQGTGDFDGDQLTDLQEFTAGTDPTSAVDRLEVLSVTAGAVVTLKFGAVAGKSYSIQYRDSWDADVWHRLSDLAASPVSGVVTVVDPQPGPGARFYRVVTPSVAP